MRILAVIVNELIPKHLLFFLEFNLFVYNSLCFFLLFEIYDIFVLFLMFICGGMTHQL